MNRTKIVLLAFALCTCLDGQSQLSKKDKRRVNALVRQAQTPFESEEYLPAWNNYRSALKMDPKNSTASLNGAICIFKLNYTMDSADLVVPGLVVSKEPDALFYLARIRHQERVFDEALQLLEKYQAVAERKRLHKNKDVRYAIEVNKNARAAFLKPRPSIIRNIGKNINSTYSDYVPVITPDESQLYFTSKRPGSNPESKNGDNNYFEDIFYSTRSGNGWSAAQNAGEPLNSNTNDGCVAISPDGQRMIVYRTAEDQLTGDLYETRLGADGKWGPLLKMTEEINSPYIETSACFSTDTSEIYFSSDRPGGFGGKDLYRIKKLPNGKWSAAYNLGATINTEYDEDAPYLHPDGVTLYYSSKGHSTMGEYDVFRNVLNREENTFGENENLGYPINDVGNDIFFVLSVDGQRGYYSSSKKESLGDVDIYQIDTRFGENDLMVRSGRVSGEKDIVRARIILMDHDTREVLGHFNSNPASGKILLIVNPLKSYRAIIEADGYQSLETVIPPLAQETGDGSFEYTLSRTDAQ